MLIIYIFILVVGLCLGSFVNAFVWRLKKKRNWITGRSECSSCRHKLGFLDLVPVFSYLLLKGRCRYCKMPIQDTPLVEVGMGVALLISYQYWPFGFDAIDSIRFGLWVISLVLLMTMFVYDLRWMILPDKLTRALLAIAGVQAVILLIYGEISSNDIPSILLSVLVGGGIFHLIYEYSKGKYIGGGDVKLGYAYGLLLLDPLLSWMTLTIASLLGSVIALGLIATKRKSISAKLPFGPLLILGLFVSMLFGQEIWAYVNTLMLY